MITLDAGVVIGYLNPDDEHHVRVREWVAVHMRDEYAASVITLAEALVRPSALGHASTARRAFELLGVTPIEAAVGDEFGIASVRAATRLRLPDAIVVYTAERIGGGLATTDAAMTRAARARGVEVFDLTE